MSQSLSGLDGHLYAGHPSPDLCHRHLRLCGSNSNHLHSKSVPVCVPSSPILSCSSQTQACYPGHHPLHLLTASSDPARPLCSVFPSPFSSPHKCQPHHFIPHLSEQRLPIQFMLSSKRCQSTHCGPAQGCVLGLRIEQETRAQQPVGLCETHMPVPGSPLAWLPMAPRIGASLYPSIHIPGPFYPHGSIQTGLLPSAPPRLIQTSYQPITFPNTLAQRSPPGSCPTSAPHPWQRELCPPLESQHNPGLVCCPLD